MSALIPAPVSPLKPSFFSMKKFLLLPRMLVWSVLGVPSLYAPPIEDEAVSFFLRKVGSGTLEILSQEAVENFASAAVKKPWREAFWRNAKN